MDSSGEFFEPQIPYDRDPYLFIDGHRQKRRKPLFQDAVGTERVRRAHSGNLSA
jgi:hypothetical protein